MFECLEDLTDYAKDYRDFTEHVIHWTFRYLMTRSTFQRDVSNTS